MKKQVQTFEIAPITVDGCMDRPSQDLLPPTTSAGRALNGFLENPKNGTSLCPCPAFLMPVHYRSLPRCIKGCWRRSACDGNSRVACTAFIACTACTACTACAVCAVCRSCVIHLIPPIRLIRRTRRIQPEAAIAQRARHC